MVQIVGWLLCLCLFVKGLELAAQSQATAGPEGERIGGSGMLESASAIAILGSLAFAAWLFMQGNELSSSLNQIGSSTPGANAAMQIDENLTVPRLLRQRLGRAQE